MIISLQYFIGLLDRPPKNGIFVPNTPGFCYTFLIVRTTHYVHSNVVVQQAINLYIKQYYQVFGSVFGLYIRKLRAVW